MRSIKCPIVAFFSFGIILNVKCAIITNHIYLFIRRENISLYQIFETLHIHICTMLQNNNNLFKIINNNIINTH